MTNIIIFNPGCMSVVSKITQKKHQAGMTTNPIDHQPRKLSCNRIELKRCTLYRHRQTNKKEL